ncbi:MAG TPA: hypothetical protein VF818_11090 [Ktedonobacterales bacterium]
MTRLQQVLAVADIATVHFGTWDVSVRNPPRDQPHAGWVLTVVESGGSQQPGSSPASRINKAPTWPVLLSTLTFLGVSLDADWQSVWTTEDGQIDLAPTRPLPRVP